MNAWEVIKMGYESWHGQAKSNPEVGYKEDVVSFRDVIDMLMGEWIAQDNTFWYM